MAKSTFYYLLQMSYQSARFDGHHPAAKEWTYNDAQDWFSLIFGLDPYWYSSKEQTNYYQVTSRVLSFTVNCGYRAIAGQRVTFDIYGGLGPSLNTSILENFDWGVPEPSRPGYDGEVVTGASPLQSFSEKRFHMAMECGIKLGYIIY